MNPWTITHPRTRLGSGCAHEALRNRNEQTLVSLANIQQATTAIAGL